MSAQYCMMINFSKSYFVLKTTDKDNSPRAQISFHGNSLDHGSSSALSIESREERSEDDTSHGT